MYDYYRFRFKILSKPRRRTRRPHPPGIEEIRMPDGVWVLATCMTVLASAGAILAIVAGRSSLGSLPTWLTVLVLLIPVTVTLAAGFSEEQAWTRPLLVALLGFAALVAGLCGLPILCAAMVLLGASSALYLYRSPEARAYYAKLRASALLRISVGDLRSWIYVPVYTAAIGFAAGAFLGWYLASLHPDYGSAGGLTEHDVYGVALLALLCGSVLGVLGRLFGEALVSRHGR